MRDDRTYLEEIEHAALKAGFDANTELFRQSLEVLSEKIPSPVIVKVGANDGVTHDPTAEAVRGHDNWRGLLIEPVPYCFERLQANYEGRFILANMAIGEETGTRPFYFVTTEARKAFPKLPVWVEMIGSFDRDFIVRLLSRAHIAKLFGSLMHFIDECNVEVDTLANVLAEHNINDITLLHIDCEGYDCRVLNSLGFIKPMNILIEHKHLSFSDKAALTAELARKQYRILDCEADYFAFQPGQWLGVCKDTYADLMRHSR